MNLLKHNRCRANRRRHGPVLAGVCAVVVVLALPDVALGAQRRVADQIAEAVAPLKGQDREDATVMGYSGGELVILRPGTNHFVCLADNPDDNRFQVSCYHESLEPFMARGRELRAAGIRRRERQRIRNTEIDSGLIDMPSRASLISLYGIGKINPRSGWPDSVTVLEVLYLPYATARETGLPDRPSRTSAYLMDAGTGRAHVMIPAGRRKFRPHEPTRRR